MCNIYLVGFMGAGKTVVGRAVAVRMDRRFVDLDDVIEERVGLSIREIFETKGEGRFRAAETAELKRITLQSHLVVATGGGAFSSPDHRHMIDESGGVSVFLDPPWEAIEDRLQGDSSRPKWIDRDRARELFLARRSDYLAASIRLELEGDETPDEIADRVVDALAEAACAS